jgi:hypothetical protein
LDKQNILFYVQVSSLNLSQGASYPGWCLMVQLVFLK